MGVAAAREGVGGIPVETTRIAALSDALTPTVDYAAEALKAARAARDRLGAEIRNGELTEAAALLTHLRARLDAMNPDVLLTRRGLGGLFDSRGRRLNRFREAFQTASRAVADATGDIGERALAVGRRHEAIEQAVAALREPLTALNDQVLAGRAWLADKAEDEHVEFRARIEALNATATGGVRAIPLARALQNADGRAAERLKAVMDSAAQWRSEWVRGLGLDARRPRRIRADVEGLARDRDALLKALSAAEAEVAEARTRRAAVEKRF